VSESCNQDSLPPNRKKFGKMRFLSIFSGKVHCTKKPSFHVKGKGQLFSPLIGSMSSGSGSALALPGSCSNECGVSVLGTALLTTLPAALAGPQNTAKVTVSNFPISGHCCAESLPPAVYAFHT